MKMNSAMKIMLIRHRILQRINEIRLENRLASILSYGIVHLNGFYFLQALLPEDFDIDEMVQSSFDEIEIECDVNHIHLQDYFDQPEENIQILLEQGVRYAYALQALMPKTEKFNIILACTFEEIIDCNIRFHNQRNGKKWLADDLEKYEELVLVLD